MSTNVYEDERLVENEAQREAAIKENNQEYSDMIGEVERAYQGQMDAVDQSAETQKQSQQEQTDLALEQIEQQRQQTQEDYIKEQKGSYRDWREQSNTYGAQAEQMAAQGLSNTGFSESAQVSMWNAYQNRIATARDSVAKAGLEYDNMMKEAMLQNSIAMAEIAANAYEQKMALALEMLGYKNDLLTQQKDREMQIQSMYESRGQSILDQIRYEEEMAYQQEQDRIANDRAERELTMQEEQWVAERELYDMYLGDEDETQQNGIQGLHGGKGSSGANLSAGKGSETSDTKMPTISVLGAMGNSSKTQAKRNYYFSNGYQPRYINNKKLKETTVTVGDIWGDSLGVPASQNVWMADGKFWVWNGKTKSYWDVTDIVDAW